ncbi:unknown [Eggerthella sp. CAG:368]|nr:unknown [Eggerthella sp. CAG:368]
MKCIKMWFFVDDQIDLLTEGKGLCYSNIDELNDFRDYRLLQALYVSSYIKPFQAAQDGFPRRFGIRQGDANL